MKKTKEKIKIDEYGYAAMFGIVIGVLFLIFLAFLVIPNIISFINK